MLRVKFPTSLRQLKSKLKSVPFMALFAVGKIVAAERTPVVVAARAALRTRRCEMHRRCRGRHLPATARTRADRVAGAAAQVSAAVLTVAEIHLESSRGRCVPGRAPRLMADAARADVSSADFRPRPVAGKARLVCRRTCRDGKGDPGA